MLYCPAFNAIAISSNLTEENKRLLSRTRCKSWQCPYCAIGNRNRWRAFLLDVLPAVSEIWSFHTVTLPAWIRKRADFSEEDRTIASLALIRANWEKLVKRLRRHCGNFEYFRCFELHGDGTLHVHVLLSLHIAESELKKVKKGEKSYHYWTELKKIAPACGFGYMMSSENLEIAAAASGYATKYMTKEDDFYSDMLKKYRIRRFQSSQGIGSQDAWGKSEDTWELRSFIDYGMIKHQEFYDTNIKRDITPKMLGDNGEYPPVKQYEESQKEQKRRAGGID